MQETTFIRLRKCNFTSQVNFKNGKRPLSIIGQLEKRPQPEAVDFALIGLN